MKRHHLLSRSLFTSLLLSSLAVQAADKPGSRNTLASAQKPPIAATVPNLEYLQLDSRIALDPRTGEVYQPGSGGNVGGSDPAPPPPEPAPIDFPYDYFDAEDQGDSTLNSYFLAQLSMGVYSDALTEADFEADMITKFAHQGIDPLGIDVRMHNASGTELAIFTIGQATVIVFRGTSSEGTLNPSADVNSDLLDVPISVDIGGKKCRIHKGFWTSSAAVYDWVLERALAAHLAGQKIILTGHSLGAARATVTAFRLLYEDGIPIQSLQTFGSPKVGDGNFKAMCGNTGAEGIRLSEVTERFVVLGDPATTFPDKEAIGFNLAGPIWVHYVHVGRTHNILPVSGQFEISFDSGEIFFLPLPSQWYDFVTGEGDSEHMWYDDALLEEVLEDPAYNAIGDLLLENEMVEQ